MRNEFKNEEKTIEKGDDEELVNERTKRLPRGPIKNHSHRA